jgi:DnaA-homolog protein
MTKMPVAEQLLLNLRPRTDARLSDFAAPSQVLLLAAIRDVLWQPASLLYVYGEAGSGRSHLLSALCAEAEQQGLSSVLLPMAELRAEDPSVLAGLEGQGLIAFDDLEAVAGHPGWEEALFHLFNRARHEAGHDGSRLVFSALRAPTACGFQLPDLVSRLSLAPLWELPLPDDAGREALLQAAATRRGLIIEPELMRYLLLRAPRGSGRLLELLETLDRHSLVAGRRLTIPFVRPLLDGALEAAV